uniref:Uncharacterized protein n=1 Tax=Capra hircus TaxID=9925 RepID=A0A8C2R113_CAPHI
MWTFYCHWQTEGLRDHVAEPKKGKREGGTQVVASCPALLPSACVPGGSPTTWLTGPSTDGGPFALSLQRVPLVLPTPQVASLPLGHSWG